MERNRLFFQNQSGFIAQTFFVFVAVFGAQTFGLVLFISDLAQGFPSVSETGGLIVSFSVILIALPPVAYPEALAMFSWNVHLGETKMWMAGDRTAAKWFRVQWPVVVEYGEVVSISVEFSYKSSSGQSICSWYYGPLWSKKRYLVVKTDSGRKKRFHVTHFTDSVLAEMIDLIAERCESIGQKYDGRRAAEILFGCK